MGLPGRRSSGTAFGELLAELREEQRRRAPPRSAAPPSTVADAGLLAPPAASPLSPLGALLDEIRAQRAAAAAGERQRGVCPLQERGAERDLSLETGIVTTRHRVGQARLVPLSLLLHATLLAALVAVPLFRAQPLPAPAGVARAFLTEPQVASPPPPPAPPRARVVAAPARPSRGPAAAARRLTVPIRTPDGVAPDAVIDLGDPAGEAGGVEGGIPGGVVGGLLGTPLPPPTPVQPVRVGGGIREPEKVRHVPPAYPEIAVRAGVSGTVVLECLVSPQGRVADVKVLRGIPLLDAAAVEAVRQWVYTPTLRHGVPVPLIMTVTVTFALDAGKPR